MSHVSCQLWQPAPSLAVIPPEKNLPSHPPSSGPQNHVHNPDFWNLTAYAHHGIISNQVL
jgi:hypothetical protein